MARGYAACLGVIALTVCSMRGLMDSQATIQTMGLAIAMSVVFAFIGFWIGTIAENLVRQSVEIEFRHSVKTFQETQQIVRSTDNQH